MVVLFPAPLGPNKPKQLPFATSKDKPLTALTCPYDFTRSFTCKMFKQTPFHSPYSNCMRCVFLYYASFSLTSYSTHHEAMFPLYFIRDKTKQPLILVEKSNESQRPTS